MESDSRSTSDVKYGYMMADGTKALSDGRCKGEHMGSA